MGPVKDVAARFAERNEQQELQEAGYISIPIETGKLYYRPGQITFEPTITIRLLSSLISRKIFVRGAKAI